MLTLNNNIAINNSRLNPNYISGFIDAVKKIYIFFFGCFHVSVVRNISLKLGVSVRALFQISLHRKDKVLARFAKLDRDILKYISI